MKRSRKKPEGLKALKDKQKEIEGMDREILTLIEKRQGLAEALGQAKREAGIDILDLAREEEILKVLTSRTESLSKDAVRRIFKEIMSAARSVQGPLNVAFLGAETSFTHQAALSLFGASAGYQSAETTEDVFDMVDKDLCNRGVVPIENAFEGSLGNVLDLFSRYELRICGENLQRIRYHLLTRAERIEDIKCLYSHPLAVAQCRAWIKNHLPGVPLKKSESSSLAAKRAAENEGAAALGSHLSARTYGLNMVEQDIGDRPDNVTRFVAIGKTDSQPTGQDKTSLLFSVNHRPGALFEALRSLARKKINMTKIESRPIRVRSWEYLFFVDLEGHAQDRKLGEALKNMEACCEEFKNLGSYPVAASPWP